MPLENSKGAPKKFTGDFHEVETFLETYEHLSKRYNVTDGKEKCRTIRRYCSKDVVWTIEGMSTYHQNDWEGLREGLLTLYDASRNDLRYSLMDLSDLTEYWEEIPIDSKGTYNEYLQDFTRVGGWLRVQDKITKDQESKYFLRGLHRDFKAKVETRLQAGYPLQPRNVEWTLQQLQEAADYILIRARQGYGEEKMLDRYDPRFERNPDSRSRSSRPKDNYFKEPEYEEEDWQPIKEVRAAQRARDERLRREWEREREREELPSRRRVTFNHELTKEIPRGGI